VGSGVEVGAWVAGAQAASASEASINPDNSLKSCFFIIFLLLREIQKQFRDLWDGVGVRERQPPPFKGMDRIRRNRAVSKKERRWMER
jgi:hypothetical protein